MAGQGEAGLGKAHSFSMKTSNLDVAPDPLTDRHYTPQELATAWGMSPEFIRRRFRYEPGVVMLGRSMRIPTAVAERVHRVAAFRSVQGPVKFARFTARTAKGGQIVLVPKGSR